MKLLSVHIAEMYCTSHFFPASWGEVKFLYGGRYWCASGMAPFFRPGNIPMGILFHPQIYESPKCSDHSFFYLNWKTFKTLYSLKISIYMYLPVLFKLATCSCSVENWGILCALTSLYLGQKYKRSPFRAAHIYECGESLDFWTPSPYQSPCPIIPPVRLVPSWAFLSLHLNLHGGFCPSVLYH